MLYVVGQSIKDINTELTLPLLSHHDMDWGSTSCFLFELLGETAPQMFHNASIWLTLVLAAQRYIYICQATRSVRGVMVTAGIIRG